MMAVVFLSMVVAPRGQGSRNGGKKKTARVEKKYRDHDKRHFVSTGTRVGRYRYKRAVTVGFVASRRVSPLQRRRATDGGSCDGGQRTAGVAAAGARASDGDTATAEDEGEAKRAEKSLTREGSQGVGCAPNRGDSN